jgi:predicted RNA-binding Zn-ribbon protein involved in translation (DUF1610 family)
MPAYSQHHQPHAMNATMAVCPHCTHLPMQMRSVEPHWSVARLVFVFECPECGTEVRETVTKQ